MSDSFKQLKRDRENSIRSLSDEFKKLNAKPQGPQEDTDNFWTPTVDKAGNGQALIRFLPPPEGESKPIIRYWDHGFQGPGGWYIEKSLTSLGQPDPCSELNAKLWSSGIESDKDQVRKQKRKLHFISNIYIIRDPANPENEGKVFLFKYGKKIFDKINDVMNPSFDGDEKIVPFDFWEGANFRLRIRNYEGYRNYDKSDFEDRSPLSKDDSELERIWKMQYPLEQFLDPSKFKTYDELKARLNKVLGVSEASKPSRQQASQLPWQDDDETEVSNTTSDDDDEGMSYFRELAKG